MNLRHDNSDFFAERLRNAPVLTASLVGEVMDVVCRHHSHPGQTAAIARLERLIAEQAWTEVALRLIDLELPGWQLRRLAYDSGEWHCALSQQREMPEWLDHQVEGCHPDRPAALLGAFIEALRISAPVGHSSVPAVPQESVPSLLCCDDFA